MTFPENRSPYIRIMLGHDAVACPAKITAGAVRMRASPTG